MASKFNFYHWLAISLALHGAVILLFVFVTSPRAPHEARYHTLRIDLAGMIAQRQVEERKGGSAGAQPARQAKQAAPRQFREKYETKESPAHAEKASDIPNPSDKTSEQAAESSGPTIPAGAAGQGPSQRGQTIAYRDQDADVTRQYLARLSKRLQANLVYPEEVRKSGIDGISTIAFTIEESGMIKAGSLRVRKSSGYASLDNNALKSATSSAPFEKPPRELNVSIAVAFTVEMASRGKRTSMR